MAATVTPDLQRFVDAIKASGVSIYSRIKIGDPNLWIPAPELEKLLDTKLRGISLAGLALRTRSKVIKEHVCCALGYPIPASFAKTQPRFPGQLFDTYVQKSNNLQVWNEELAATRRYVLVRVDANDTVCKVKVVTGEALALLDTTGTLTQKYQARCVLAAEKAELIVERDTTLLQPFTRADVDLAKVATPVSKPTDGQLLAIKTTYEKLVSLIGSSFEDAGRDQERNRGAALHQLVCKTLGYASYQDDGQFPDVRHQLLEVKLQTSPTIDLGLVRPNSTEPLDVPQIGGAQIRHCDVRYAVFYAVTDGKKVMITHFFLTTGEAFFTRFAQFQGKVLNSKIQIPLPSGFFA
jgi:hypothetical protein